MKKLQPELRFKEFSGDWEEKKMSRSFPKIRNGFVGVATPFYVEKGIKYLQGKNIKNGKIDPKGLINISDSFHQKKLNSQIFENDILMVQSGHVGECAKVTKSYNNSNCHALLVLTPTKDTISSFFINYFYSSIGKKQINKIKTGNTIEHILSSDIKNVMVLSPSLPEQEKIASFLSSVDDKIQKLEGKKEKLGEYKKGIMQKVFSQEIRFFDENGNLYPQWELLKAKKIFKNQSNKNHNGDLPTLAVTQDKGVVFRSDLDLKINSSEAGIKNYKIIEPGDFVISLRSFQGGIEYSNILGISSPAYTVLKPKLPISDNFYKNYLKKEDFISKLNGAIVGIRDGKQISYSVFGDLKLFYPCLEEQEKIAKFLSSVDVKIEKVGGEIDRMEEFKKGLLQGMFV